MVRGKTVACVGYFGSNSAWAFTSIIGTVLLNCSIESSLNKQECSRWLALFGELVLASTRLPDRISWAGPICAKRQCSEIIKDHAPAATGSGA